MNRRTRRTLLIVAAVLALLALAVLLRSKAPPEAARLLPESDGILYVNLKPFRAFFPRDLKPPRRVPEYQAFVDATGIDWERDLDQVAIGIHRMKDPNGPNGPVAYSMVLVGKLTGQKLNRWLAANAAATESYAGKTIFDVPSDGRTVRVAQIGYDMVAVSNTPTPEQIHSIIDRHRTAALPFAGSSLLENHYRDVPLLAFAWGVGQIGLPFSERGSISILGLELPLPSDSTIVASLSPTLPITNGLHFAGLLHCRIEEIAKTDAIAAAQAQTLGNLVSVFQQISIPLADTPVNDAFKELLKTAKVARRRDRVVVSATVSPSFFTAALPQQNPMPGQTTSSPEAASK